jgi:hypothetical protein
MILPVVRNKVETEEERLLRSKKKKKIRFKMKRGYSPEEPTGDVLRDAWREYFCYLDMMKKVNEYFFASTLKQIMTKEDIRRVKRREKNLWIAKKRRKLDRAKRPNLSDWIYGYRERREDSEIIQESLSSNLIFKDMEESEIPHKVTLIAASEGESLPNCTIQRRRNSCSNCLKKEESNQSTISYQKVYEAKLKDPPLEKKEVEANKRIVLIPNKCSRRSKKFMTECLKKINYHPPPSKKKEIYGNPSNRTLRKKMNDKKDCIIRRREEVSYLFKNDSNHSRNSLEDSNLRLR